MDKRSATPHTELVGAVLAFDIWSDFAHYRKIETTTSPLTYSIPTGTALAGMLAAILGLYRDSYYEIFSPNNTRFAIKILNPLKKTRINITLLDTSRGFFLRDIGENPRTLIPHEFMKNPKYRIYVWMRDDSIRTKLQKCLQEHKSHYTPCLGTANLIAGFSYVDEYDMKRVDEELVQSVARMDNGKLLIELHKQYFIEKIPVSMDRDRVVQDYAEIVYEVKGEPVKMSGVISYRVGSDNIVFL
jgi:CRISPR-associated protein Cas5h